MAIKTSLPRYNFKTHPEILRRLLLEQGFEELSITGEHAVMVCNLPRIHDGPFDRIMLAQAICEGIYFLTHDNKLKDYSGPVVSV